MESKIRFMAEGDRREVIDMMRGFYASPAVFSNGSEEIFEADFNNCIGDSPFLEGFIFEVDGKVGGYGMVARSFSTEFGKPCIWIEDIFIKSEYRGLGIGSGFIRYVEERYPGCIFRIEVEEENERAVRVYKKCGYSALPYMEMKK